MKLLFYLKFEKSEIVKNNKKNNNSSILKI